MNTPLRRSLALILSSCLASLAACGPDGSELDGKLDGEVDAEALDLGAVVRSAMEDGQSALDRTQRLSQQIETAWNQQDQGQALAALAADPAAFQSSILGFLTQAGREQLPPIRAASSKAIPDSTQAAILIEADQARLQLTFDPYLDPARLTGFQALPADSPQSSQPPALDPARP